MPKLNAKIVGGCIHSDGKGIDFPPAYSLEMGTNNEEDWIIVQLQKTRKKETER